jgi:hypothetical protein
VAGWLTDDELDALKRAYASGILTVETRYGRVTYQNLDSLFGVISREEQARASATGHSTNRSVIRFGNGGYGRSWERW